MASSPEITVDVRGSVALVILNRPAKLNCLNLSMIKQFHQEIDSLEKRGIRLIVIRGSGDRAFCAGGDVVRLRTAIVNGEEAFPRNFFYNEYRLVYALATLSTPRISLWDGFVFGGGVGISGHGGFRIATEKTLFGLPECAIGLYPDVGAPHLLARLPHSSGYYIGLTGARLNHEDCLYLNVATHFLLSSELPKLQEKLLVEGNEDLTNIERILTECGAVSSLPEYGRSYIHQNRELIDHCFSADSVSDIRLRLREKSEKGDPRAAEILKTLNAQCPSSLQITYHSIKSAAKATLAQSLEMEFGISQSLMNRDGEFAEGVRAMLVDKDKKPRWKYSDLEQVPLDEIQGICSIHEGSDELGLHTRLKATL